MSLLGSIAGIAGGLLGGGKSGGSSSSTSATTKVGQNQVSGRGVVGLTGPQQVKVLQQVNRAFATGQKTSGTIIVVAGVVAVAFLFLQKQKRK